MVPIVAIVILYTQKQLWGHKLRLIYKNCFGYKKYIKDFPNDWWILYENGNFEIPAGEKVYVCVTLSRKMPHRKNYDNLISELGRRKRDKRLTESYEKYESTEESFAKFFKDEARVLFDCLTKVDLYFSDNDFVLEGGKLKFRYFGENFDIKDLIDTLESFQNFIFDDEESQLLIGTHVLFWPLFFSNYEILKTRVDHGLMVQEGDGVVHKIESGLEKFQGRMINILVKAKDFLSVKFQFVNTPQEVRTFVDSRLNSIEELKEKVYKRAQSAYNLYEKNKLKLKGKDNVEKNDNKTTFICDYILLNDGELLKKYTFLNQEDLKIENNSNLIIDNS